MMHIFGDYKKQAYDRPEIEKFDLHKAVSKVSQIRS